MGAVRMDQAVEYVGVADEHLFQGHPGRVFSIDRMPSEVMVSFVNGPSLCTSPACLLPIDEEEYLHRGRRLVCLQHPVDDRPVPPFVQPGQEWPEGHEPGGS